MCAGGKGVCSQALSSMRRARGPVCRGCGSLRLCRQRCCLPQQACTQRRLQAPPRLAPAVVVPPALAGPLPGTSKGVVAGCLAAAPVNLSCTSSPAQVQAAPPRSLWPPFLLRPPCLSDVPPVPLLLCRRHCSHSTCSTRRLLPPDRGPAGGLVSERKGRPSAALWPSRLCTPPGGCAAVGAGGGLREGARGSSGAAREHESLHVCVCACVCVQLYSVYGVWVCARALSASSSACAMD